MKIFPRQFNAFSLRLTLSFTSLLFLSLTGCGGGGGSFQETDDRNSYMVSGTIQIGAGTATDSDTNDIDAAKISNNSLGEQQSIPNPATVGGYIGQSGEVGAHQILGDTVDLYSVNLTEGDTVILFPINCSVNFDLKLYEGGIGEEFLIDSSTNQTGIETIEAPANANGGVYFLELTAESGSGNYILKVGTGTFGSNLNCASRTSANGNSLSLDSDFVPGDILVKYKSSSQAGLVSSQSFSTASLTNQLGLHHKQSQSDGSVLYSLEQTRSLSFSTQSVVPYTHSAIDNMKQDTIDVINQLNKDSSVEIAQPNYIYRQLTREPNDPLYGLQWHYENINLPYAWIHTEEDNDAAAVTVAVLDSGILPTHPDLSEPGKLVDGFDFVNDTSLSADGDGRDSDPTDPGEDGFNTSFFHGTHVAGTIGASTNNNTGVAGIAWNVKIMPLRVLGLGGAGYTTDIIEAIKYLSQSSSVATPSQKADIVNMSLGGPALDLLLQAAISEARAAHDIIFVAAAGNEATTQPSYPAANEGVISVSAVDYLNNITPYSNTGSTIDVAAPGGFGFFDQNGDNQPDSVFSTNSLSFSDRYEFSDGTSMAAPHVAGVIALMKAANPDLTPSTLDTLLNNGAITRDLGATGRDDIYGNGLIDALKAVQAAKDLSGNPIPARLILSPSRVNFGDALNSATVFALNAGSESLIIDSAPTSTQPWLTIVKPTGAAEGEYPLGGYTLTVSRDGLSDGNHTANVVFTYNGGETVELPISLTVSSQSLEGNAGQHYVIVVDPTVDYEAENTFPIGVVVNASNGVYTYEISDIPRGDYHIIAGNDLDSDGKICGLLEACGGYSTRFDPTLLTIDNNQSGLDFFTLYDLGVTSTVNSQSNSQFNIPKAGIRVRPAQ